MRLVRSAGPTLAAQPPLEARLRMSQGIEELLGKGNAWNLDSNGKPRPGYPIFLDSHRFGARIPRVLARGTESRLQPTWGGATNTGINVTSRRSSS